MRGSMTSLAILAVFVDIFATVDAANALPIDFRDSATWGAGDGAGSITVGGITVSANGGQLYRDNTDGF